MKVVGIIAEFNPFHEGHAYLIRQAKEQCHADHIIVCMSNYYVQRGEPAIIPPNERVRADVICPENRKSRAAKRAACLFHLMSVSFDR